MARPQWLYIAHNWRHPKVIIGMLAFEFFLTIACLTIYAVAEPDVYRYKLWQDGADHGFNSAPSVVKYAAANYININEPIVWSDKYVVAALASVSDAPGADRHRLVQFDIAISVVSMFVLLVKTVLFVMKMLLPIVCIFVHLAPLALYATSLGWQTTPDTADPDHPQKGLPWYISKGCGYASQGNYGYCQQAQTVFALTVVMVAFMSIYILLAIWNCVPSKEERLNIDESRKDKKEWDLEMKQYKKYEGPGSDRERREAARAGNFNIPKTPMSAGFNLKNPMTPRTTAFTQLSGEDPEPHPKSSGALPFRQQWGDSVTPVYK